MWIWQHQSWPSFRYDKALVLPKLESCVQAVSPLKQLSAMLSVEQRLDWEAAILLDETLSSAKLEGEHYDRDSVRSSIVNKLGIGKGKKFNQQSDAMVELLLSAIRSSSKPVAHDVVKSWHHTLFSTAPIVTPLIIGDYRNDEMQIISGCYGKQTVHFQAPHDNHSDVSEEMDVFFNWLNNHDEESAFVRAAIAKFWFVTIHPFDDGNGRLSRVIAERCLAEAEDTDLRLFSLSSVLLNHRNDYYQQLEDHQSCKLSQNQTLDLTQWIIWFLLMVEEAAIDAKKEFERVMVTTRFWQTHQLTDFNDRQKKLVTRLLETKDFSDGISRKKYKALVKTTDATAVRDITNLVEKAVLTPVGEGRSRKYLIKLC